MAAKVTPTVTKAVTDYSKFTPAQVANQSKYLSNLYATNPAKKTWAASEIAKLHTATSPTSFGLPTMTTGGGSDTLAKTTATPIPADTSLQDMYAEQLKGSQDAVNAGTQATVTEALNQKAALAPMYDQARSGAYVTGRVNAIGNNEQLASQGLSGALYGSPTSGTSETSRIAGNVSMQDAINSFTKDEKNAVNTLDQEILKAKTAGNVELARLASENKASLMAALIAKREKEATQAKAEYTANIGQFGGDYMAEAKRVGVNDPHYAELMAAHYSKAANNAAEALKQKNIDTTNNQAAQNEKDRVAQDKITNALAYYTAHKPPASSITKPQSAAQLWAEAYTATKGDPTAMAEYIKNKAGFESSGTLPQASVGTQIVDNKSDSNADSYSIDDIKTEVENAPTIQAANKILQGYIDKYGVNQAQVDYIQGKTQ